MHRKFLVSSVSFALVAVTAIGWPAVANAQGRGRGGGRVVVARPVVVRPIYGAFSPFFYDPWFGSPWGWGGPYGWGYPYGGFRFTNEVSLRVDVRPRDAQVYVDGYFAGDVDQFDGRFQRLRVTPGQHEITIYKAGYKTVRERLYLSPNSSRKLTHDLDRLAAGEADEAPPVPVEPVEPAEPVDPSVQSGSAPSGPPPGVRVPPPLPRRSPGAQPAPGGARRSAPSGRNGSVSIRVQPGGSDIYVDGERWAGGDADDRLIVQLPEGPHHIEVQKDGYRGVTVDVEVRRGETAPVNVVLSRE